VPPPWRRANAITSDAPAADAIQNTGFGRSWVMATATSAVAMGRIPITTPPCEASTVCTASAISNGNRMLTHSMAITSWNQSLRGGSGRSQHQAARRARTAQRSRAQRREGSGSIPKIARRVAGSVPPEDRWAVRARLAAGVATAAAAAQALVPARDRHAVREHSVSIADGARGADGRCLAWPAW